MASQRFGEEPGYGIVMGAGAALNEARIVKLGANAREVVQSTAATEVLIGVAYRPGDSNPAAISQGQGVTVMTSGLVDITSGAAVAAGAYVTSDANGKAVGTTTDGDFVIGIAMRAVGGADEPLPVLINKFRY